MARWMSTARVMLAAIGLLALLPDAAPAQTTLEVVVKPRDGNAYVVHVDPEGPRVLSSRTLGTEELDWAFGSATSDGRFLVAATAELQSQFPEPFNLWELTAHDRLSGDTIRLPRGRDVPVFRTHPRRTEVVWSDSVGPAVLGIGGQRYLGGCGYGNIGSLSADGSRAVYQCLTPYHFEVIDVDHGGVVSDLGPSPGAWPVLDANGQGVYDLDLAQLRRRAVDTRAELARAVLPGEQNHTVDALHVDPRTGDVYVLGNGVHVFDGVTLAPLRSQVPAAVRYVHWVFDPDRPRIYTIGHAGGQPAFWVLDSTTLQVLVSAPIPGLVETIALRRVPTPAAPARLAATVQGSSVTLTWAEGLPVTQSLRYVLEVGSAPGLNDIFSGLDVGLQTSFGASNVPPGTYYVRVRAGNYSGLGAPSNEVEVQVR